MTTCPRCGSVELLMRPSGDYACIPCGHAWTPREPKKEMPKP